MQRTMAVSALVDAGFLVALLSSRDAHHEWAARLGVQFPAPWYTCEAVLSESFHLLGARGYPALSALLRRAAAVPSFDLRENVEPVVRLMHKYANVPMSLADACLVRMTETITEPIVLTTDRDFRIYRRHGRQTIPCRLPV